MKRLITVCPSCNHNLHITALHCPECGLELRNSFELSPFDKLSNDQYDFLMSFLRNRGNLKQLQTEQQISYPLAKKKLDEMLSALGIESEVTDESEPEVIDVSRVAIDTNSTKASEIVKAKLIEAGGRAMVRLYGGELREISSSLSIPYTTIPLVTPRLTSTCARGSTR